MPAKVSVTLKPQKIELAGMMKKFFIVDSDLDASLLGKNNHAAIAVGFSDGSSLSEWTPSKGVGNWGDDNDDVPLMNKIKGYVAFSPATMNSPKTQKFIKALREEFIARGAGLEVLKVPNGESVGALSEKHFGDYLYEVLTPPAESGGEGGGDDSEETDSKRLVRIAKDHFNFHWSDEDGGFLTLKEGPKSAYIVSGGTPSLRNYLISKYLEIYNEDVPSRSMVSDAIAAVEALCDMSDSRVRKLSIRAARSATGRVWIDLGRLDGLCVSISSEGLGMSHDTDSDVFFKRTDQVKELPIPAVVQYSDIKDVLYSKLRGGFNISDTEFPMVCAWMVTQIVPDFSAPVAMFLGKSGSGKTTATSILSTILENVTDNGALMPEGKDNLAVTISQEKISIWNNVSKITNQISDDICQYIDGASYRKRKLHSNNDVVSMTLEPSILLNGISFEEDLRADLKTRSVVFNLKTLEAATGSIDDVITDIKKDHAEILGAIYALTALVLKNFSAVQLPPGGSRMAEYLKVILILDKVWDLGEETLNQYTKSSSEMSYDSLSSAVFKRLHADVVKEANLNKDLIYEKIYTNEELIDLFSAYKEGFGTHDWNELLDLKLTTHRKMASYLNRHITDWQKFGVSLVDHGQMMVDGVRKTRKTLLFNPSNNDRAWLNHWELEEAKAKSEKF